MVEEVAVEVLGSDLNEICGFVLFSSEVGVLVEHLLQVFAVVEEVLGQDWQE